MRWSATENVRWTVDVPGRGWSSPIVWNGRVYVTSAISGKPFKQPTPGLYGNDYIAELRKQGLPDDEVMRRVQARDNEGPEESDVIRYMVYALDARTGEIIWEREAHKGLPSGGRHRKNTYASETPATDGERLYVSFGQNIGLFCFTLDGTPLWKRQWPPTADLPGLRHRQLAGRARRPRLSCSRTAKRSPSSPRSTRSTGAEVWRTPRPYDGFLKSSWSTPLVWTHPGRTELVTTGHGTIRSYGLTTARSSGGSRMPAITMPTPSPLVWKGLLYAGTGRAERRGEPAVLRDPARRRPATSRRQDGETGNAFVAWRQPRASGYTPSALVHDGRVYLVHDTGIMGVYAADTGRELFKARVGGVGHTFSASPVAAGNHLYFLDEEGTTVVVEGGDTYKEVAQNALNEMSLASPAVAEGALFIRTEKRLYRIGP